LNQNEVYLVVFRLRFQSGSDEVAVWVNPNTGGADETMAGVTPTTSTGSSDQSSVLSLQVLSALDSSGPLYLDEFRVGTEWTDVTPAAGALVAARLSFTALQQVSFVGETLHPVIVQVQSAGGLDVPSNNVPVTLAMTAGSGTLNGTLTRFTDTTGKAVFTNLSFSTSGSGKQITASSSGPGAGLPTESRGDLWVIKNPDAGSASPTSPIISQWLMSGNSFIIRGNNGLPNGEYRVLRSTNIASPTGQWVTIATNSYHASGGFAFTNAVAPGSRHFYRISSSAGGSSGAFPHVGYASVGGTITGGGNTTNIVVVTNLAGFAAATSGLEPRIVYVDGTFPLRTTGNTYLGPNKTIIGLGTGATLMGDLGIYFSEGSTTYSATNIIIRNLHITNPDDYGENDVITMKYASSRIWIDHCTFLDSSDGMVDATREADFITVSWCKFSYSVRASHNSVNLIGGADEDSGDAGKLHVTFHHNWYGSNCVERMPSVRFGRVHVFNNFFDCPGNNYCIRTRLNAEVLVENNHYQGVQNAWELATSSLGDDGLLRATGNITNNCTFTTSYAANLPNNGIVVLIPGNDALTPAVTDPIGLNPPPYAYALDPAADVMEKVTTHAGAGKGPFAP
jgi:pectate lyase